MLIRMIHPDDAAAYLDMWQQVLSETTFMLREPDEQTISVEEQRQQIVQLLSLDNSAIFVAEHEGQLVGALQAFGGCYRRDRHNVYIVIGILQGFAGQGIGTQLFQTLEHWARQHHLTRLELTVMVHNERAIALYKKCGFEIEGRRRNAIRVDGRYVDEWTMARLLDEIDTEGEKIA